MEKPVDAQAFFDGSYYKVGLHGKAFIWIEGEWKRSSKDKAEIIKNTTKS